MKSKIILVSILLLTPIACAQKPFPKPENLAQKISNYVVVNDKSPYSTTYMYGSKWESKALRHDHRIYVGNKIYNIHVWILENGQKQLYIVYALTNVNFDNLKTPADVIADILSGQPKMYRIVHLTDWEMDIKVDAFYAYQKPREKYDGRIGFTEEEFGLPFEESGIQGYIFADGEIIQDGRWVEASPEEIKKIQEEYNKFLSEIANYLKIK